MQYGLIIQEKHYRISTDINGIFLKIIENNGQEKTLRRLPSVETKYQLIHALLDGLISRFLAHNFSWKIDQYAVDLRIGLAILVPSLAVEHLAKKSYLKKLSGNLSDFTVEQFNGLKRFLDNVEGKYGLKEYKFKILRIKDNDVYILTDYNSSDSEKEHNDTTYYLRATDIIPLSTMQINAGHAEFIRYLEGELSELPKKIYRIDRLNLPETTIDYANKDFLIRNLNNSFNEESPKKFNSDGHIIGAKDRILVDTPIFIPGFRGVNHMQGRFSDEVRRLLRKHTIQSAKTKRAYFSEAVLKTHFDFYQDIEMLRQFYEKESALYSELLKTANTLKEQLLNIQKTQHILVRGLSEGGGKDKKLFGNLLDVLQHVYTNGIISFQRMLTQIGTDLGIQFKLPNAYNPFVSESESPYHACRYALGLKSPYELAALKPRYRTDGRPSYPYLGEIHITLRRLDTLVDPQERRSLVREKKHYAALNASYVIGPELEATALGYLAEGEVVHSEVIRCPNFSIPYKKEFQERYGFSPLMFYLFQKKIIQSVGKVEHESILAALFEWLCCYHTVRLIEKAKQLASDKKGQLAFLSSDHGISPVMPDGDVSIDKRLDEMRKKIAAKLLESRDGRKKGALAPVMETQLTTKKQSFFGVSPEEIYAAGTNIGLKKEDIEALFSIDNMLRTPPTQRIQPRTPLSSGSSHRNNNPYHYGFTPPTPLSGDKEHKKNEHPYELITPSTPLRAQKRELAEDRDLLASSFFISEAADSFLSGEESEIEIQEKDELLMHNQFSRMSLNDPKLKKERIIRNNNQALSSSSSSSFFKGAPPDDYKSAPLAASLSLYPPQPVADSRHYSAFSHEQKNSNEEPAAAKPESLLSSSSNAPDDGESGKSSSSLPRLG